MCGIIGYIGHQDSVPIVIKGLKRLEYRGYDSAGIATVDSTGVKIVKNEGKVARLEKNVDESTLRGNIGIGHTRWATHGAPSDTNAHPHLDETGKIALVHNGIIENYDSLRKLLEREGVKFETETDTEVLVQLIGRFYHADEMTLAEAVQAALQDVVGTYGIVVISADEPDSLIAARMGSPLVLGIGEEEFFLASDASPIIPHTRNVVYLDDGDLVEINKSNYEVRRIGDNKPVNKVIERIEYNLEEIEKGG
ncbi:MAG: class II glutamine amidotransferase, partial [Candidatus Marinimicrobia bacterium]|nr:class II glutamine amidotransferase [Candidatus Neomarinimicrobiota bacterium]